MDTRRLTEEQARALLRSWQTEFGLSDWNIQIAIRRRIEMKDNADIFVTETKRCAFIRLLHPDDAAPDEMEPYDMELALVHEVMHTALAPFISREEGDHKDIVQEQAVHAMSKTVVSMKRSLRASQQKLIRQKRAA